LGHLIPFAVPFDVLAEQEDVEVARLGDDPVHEAVVHNLELERIRRTLRELVPGERQAVCLAYGLDDGHERSVQQVADEMGVSALTAARLQFAAMYHLAESCGDLATAA